MLYCFTSYLLMHILFVSVNNKVVVLPYHRKTKGNQVCPNSFSMKKRAKGGQKRQPPKEAGHIKDKK